MADLDPELCNCFLDEAKELLEGAERCFLDLEKADRGPAVFDHMLRLAHNLKGSAGAVGFDGLSKFTHKLESVLLRLKNGECSSHQKLISLLLECGVQVKKLQVATNFRLTKFDGCLISHDHGDHASAVGVLMRQGVDCYMSQGTWAALVEKFGSYAYSGHRLHIVESGKAFYIRGDWVVKPFEVAEFNRRVDEMLGGAA